MTEPTQTKAMPASRENFKAAISQFHREFIERLVSLGLDPLTLAPEDQAVKMQLLLDKLKPRADLAARLCGIAARGKKQDADSQVGIQEAIRLIGFFNSRMFICAELMSEVFKNPIFARDGEKGTFLKSVREILKYTKQMIDVVGEESRFKETAFASGLIYDALYFYIQEHQNPETRSRLNIFLEQQFKYCQEALKQSLLLGKSLDKLAIGDRLPCLLALTTAGQISQFLFFPEMVTIYRKLNEKNASESVFRYAQLALCGGYSSQFSRQLSLAFGLFSNIPLALEFFTEPHLISNKKSAHAEDQRALAELCHFSWVITKYSADIERRKGAYPAKEVCPELSNSSLIYDFTGAS